MDLLTLALIGIGLWVLSQPGALGQVEQLANSDVYSDGDGDITYGGYGGDGTVSGTDQDTLARTIYGEARNQGQQGMQAVANVVVNRLNAGSFGSTIAAICKAPKQFSCWNATDPNRAIITSVSADNATFAQCIRIAQQACAGSLPDITDGATYYYAPAGMPGGRAPSWAASMIVTARIGSQIFLKPNAFFLANSNTRLAMVQNRLQGAASKAEKKTATIPILGKVTLR